MLTMNSTEVRKNWSEVSDTVIRERPQFIKRTRDYMMLSNIDFLKEILKAYTFSAMEYKEDDGSITLSLNEIDIIENGENSENAKTKLAKAILEYAYDYYDDFRVWSAAPNRKEHIPYVFKALILDDVQKIKECITCQAGKN